MRRIVLFAAMLAVAGAAGAQQDYPNRPLRMIVPWPPGQATDLVGRVMAQKMSDVLGQQIVIDNRAGAGGMIGTDVAAKATKWKSKFTGQAWCSRWNRKCARKKARCIWKKMF